MEFFRENGFKLIPLWFILIAAAFITLSGNLTFLQKLAIDYDFPEHLGFVFSLLAIIFALTTLLLSLFYVFLPLKWAISILILISVCCAYFTDSFGIIIDVEMIRNTLQTDIAEARDLFSMSLVLRLLLFAVLPIVLIWLCPTPLTERPIWLKKSRTIGLLSLISIVLITISVGLYSAQFSSFIRQHKQLRYYINPIQPIYSAVKYLDSQFKSTNKKNFITLSNYASIPKNNSNRRLVIMVVGETARADHFSLNGYQRETNPLLSLEENVINYPKMSSCGTSTAISVPCMFSLSSKDKFDADTASYTENALDIIAKAQVSVLWRDNNSSSKGVADRLPFEDFKKPANNPICADECLDIGLLSGLQEYIDQQSQSILIVFHQMGSHGPAYYKRYPKEFEKFTPTCQTAELANCSQQEIVNAYDNSLLYTDYFLAKIIELLKTNSSRFQTSMLYVSDHGESLGENGIYLHGLPYAFAPDSQTHVPVILWTNSESGIDIEATRQHSLTPNSHDAVAKTLISLFAIETDAVLGEAPNLVKFKASH